MQVLAEIAIKFVMGGVVVSAFCLIADILRPKTFAGIFGGAPSVALATLGLTFASKGGTYVSLEARSMLAGAAALLIYSLLVGFFLLKREANVLVTSSTLLLAWLGIAFGAWSVVLR